MRHTPAARWIAAVVLLVSAAAPALAQSCGGSAGSSPSCGGATETSWLAGGRGVVRLSEEYEVKDRSYRHGSRVENDFDESLFISRTSLDVRYGLDDDWSVGLTLTYPHFTYRLRPPGGERAKFRSRGPGDTFLAVGRRIVFGEAHDAVAEAPGAVHPMDDGPPPRALALSVWGGVALPTGTTDRPNPAFVRRDVSVANIQTGTGTFDPIVRVRAEWPQTGFTPFAEASARVPLYENRWHYRTGDSETLVAGASVPVVPRLSAGLAAMYQRSARDTFRGDDVGVGGARWVYAVPSVAWQVTDTLAVDLSVRLPVYRRTDTKLSDSSAVFQAGITFGF